MRKQIETLREELNRLTEEENCLYSDKIVKLSQQLDRLIYKYYLGNMVA